MSMKPQLRVHVLYEHTVHPHSSSFIRLLQPLTYPLLAEFVEASHGVMYRQLDADVVIVDRFWNPDEITLEVAKDIVNEIRIAGASYIYALDDNFFDIPKSHPNCPREDQLQAVDYFLRTADMIWVTTPYLQKSFEIFNPKIQVLPNCLDERLLVRRAPNVERSPFGPDKIIIGYMGTLTHDDDLLMILPALQSVCGRHPEVEIQIIGVAGHSETHEKLRGLPIRFIQPNPGEDTYPNFMLWYTNWVSWDIAIAPLMDTDFNRAKSDIKFLDYAVIGAAGIYSDVRAYRESVIHQENGLLVSNQPDDWEDALERLLKNNRYRTKFVTNAQRYVFSTRLLKRRIPDWLEALH